MKVCKTVSHAIRVLKANPGASAVAVTADNQRVYIVGVMQSFDQVERCALTKNGAGVEIVGNLAFGRLVGNVNWKLKEDKK